jgi:hypothetical protein
MESHEGTTGTAARKSSGARAAGVTATGIALCAAAIFFGTRHAADSGASAAAPPAPPPARAAPPINAPHPTAAGPTGPAAAPTVNRPPRHLQAANRHELETTLPKQASVDVTANDGDPEAFRLAQEIHGFLLAKGYQVAEVTRSVSTPPARGVGLEPLPGGRWRVIVGGADE